MLDHYPDAPDVPDDSDAPDALDVPDDSDAPEMPWRLLKLEQRKSVFPTPKKLLFFDILEAFEKKIKKLRHDN